MSPTRREEARRKPSGASASATRGRTKAAPSGPVGPGPRTGAKRTVIYYMKQLPAYLQRFDVCCLYYKTEATFNNYRNPKKLLEYLATGKPVVSVSILEVEHFREYVAIADSYAEYNTLLRRALREDPPADREKRIRFAARQTWDDVAAGISERIRSVMRS